MIIGTAKRVREGEKPKPTRYFSDKQEKSVAKAINGNQTANSGATDWQKSDVLTEQFTIECKTKMKSSDSISLKKEWFEKQKHESLFMGKPYYAIVFNFGPGEENHYVINEELFEHLLEYLKELKKN